MFFFLYCGVIMVVIWRQVPPIGAKFQKNLAVLGANWRQLAVLGANLAPIGAISKKNFFFLNKFFKFIHTCI
jgi:hypothetical protein